MTPQQTVGIFVRIFAVWLVVSAIQLIGYGVALNGQLIPVKTLAPYFTSVVMFVCALVLWFFPMVVAHKLIPRTQFDNTLSFATIETAVVACIVLGLWLFVARSLPILTNYVTVEMTIYSNQPLISSTGVTYNTHLVEGIVYLAASALLTFRARKITTYFLA